MRIAQVANRLEQFRKLTGECVEHKKKIGLLTRDYQTLAEAAQKIFDKHGLTEDKVKIVTGEVPNLLPAWLLIEGTVTQDEYYKLAIEVEKEISRTGLSTSYIQVKDSSGHFKIIPLIPEPIYGFNTCGLDDF